MENRVEARRNQFHILLLPYMCMEQEHIRRIVGETRAKPWQQCARNTRSDVTVRPKQESKTDDTITNRDWRWHTDRRFLRHRRVHRTHMRRAAERREKITNINWKSDTLQIYGKTCEIYMYRWLHINRKSWACYVCAGVFNGSRFEIDFIDSANVILHQLVSTGRHVKRWSWNWTILISDYRARDKQSSVCWLVLNLFTNSDVH